MNHEEQADRSYLAGLRRGWNLGIANDQERFQAEQESYRREIADNPKRSCPEDERDNYRRALDFVMRSDNLDKIKGYVNETLNPTTYCPKCGTELVNREPGHLLATKPPQIRLDCPDCKEIVYRPVL